MYLNYPCGIALAHNGNLTNDKQLRDVVEQHHRHLNTESDSEVLMNIFAEELRKQLDPIVLPKRDLNGLNGAVVVWDAAANEWGVDVPALGFGATLLPVKPERLEWLRGSSLPAQDRP